MLRSAYERGELDCYMDRCENCPFSSTGGLENRGSMIIPKYISEADAQEYLAGYIAMAQKLYGYDWQTCEFSWKPALEIRDDETLPPT